MLAFTPPSLAHLDPAPVFVLRAATSRDQRFHTRLYDETGVVAHGAKEIRAELLAGLKEMWTEEQFADHAPLLAEYWEAQDDFDLQVKSDPEIKWEYDAEQERAIGELIDQVFKEWPALRRIKADNREFGQMMVPIMLATMVKDWRDFDHKRELDRGYLSVDCAEGLVTALEALAERSGLARALPVSELFTQATQRMNLDREEAKNSASPSPSGMSPQPSNEAKASEQVGTSPASARSKKTPKTA